MLSGTPILELDASEGDSASCPCIIDQAIQFACSRYDGLYQLSCLFWLRKVGSEGERTIGIELRTQLRDLIQISAMKRDGGSSFQKEFGNATADAA